MCFHIVYELFYSSEVGIKVVQVAPQAVGTVGVTVRKLKKIEFIGRPAGHLADPEVHVAAGNFDAVDGQITHPRGCGPATISKRVGPYQHAAFGVGPCCQRIDRVGRLGPVIFA